MKTVLSRLSGIARAATGAGLALFSCAVLLGIPILIFAQDQFSTLEDGKTMVVTDAPDMEVYAFGKSVIVKQRVKGVLAIGGDIIVEGSVSGDAATLGGSITQASNAYIGGDVIVIGGKYKPESESPLREAGKETIMFAVLEDELRELGQNPSKLFSPELTPSFFAIRALSVLFWFIVSFLFATLAPGAVSRAIVRVHLSTLKVSAIGMLTLVLTIAGVMLAIEYLPNYIGASVFLMALISLMLAFVFGRVALNLSVGKVIQKYIFRNGNRSETVAILLGVLFWTILLSIPYIWTFGVITLFVTGLGLVLTARSPATWRQT